MAPATTIAASRGAIAQAASDIGAPGLPSAVTTPVGTHWKFQFLAFLARLFLKKYPGNSLRLARDGDPGASDFSDAGLE